MCDVWPLRRPTSHPALHSALSGLKAPPGGPNTHYTWTSVLDLSPRRSVRKGASLCRGLCLSSGPESQDPLP